MNLKFYFLRKAFLDSLIPIYASPPNPLQRVVPLGHASYLNFSVSAQNFYCTFISVIQLSNVYFSHQVGCSSMEETGCCVRGYAGAQDSVWHVEKHVHSGGWAELRGVCGTQPPIQCPSDLCPPPGVHLTEQK